MKAKIDKDGHLSFWRKGEFKEQECPFQQQAVACGDWCPLFSISRSGDGRIILETCFRMYYVDELTELMKGQQITNLELPLDKINGLPDKPTSPPPPPPKNREERFPTQHGASWVGQVFNGQEG